MTKRILLYSVLIGALTAAMSVSAQSTDAETARHQTPDVTLLDDIAVVGRSGAAAINNYASTIRSAPAGRPSARWDRRICVRVINMSAEHADYLRERIETVATAVGLMPDRRQDCRPTISIYAAEDANGLAASLIDSAPRSFQPARHSVSLGDAALAAFRTSEAPVRWWHVSLPVMADTGMPAIVLGGGVGDGSDPLARSVAVHNASHLRSNVRDDLMGVTIIIDIEKVKDTPFNAVSDYAAFVALVPTDPRRPTGQLDTVLNLFSRPDLTGLTAMDEDYLFALYASSRSPASASLQTSEIAGRMISERRRR